MPRSLFQSRLIAVALGLVTAFLLGREAASWRAPALVPQVHAQVGLADVADEVPRWEYTCFSSLTRVEARANDLGAEGWEMVAAAGAGGGGGPMLNQEYFFCFKRPLG
jgi:hypothetical protein